MAKAEQVSDFCEENRSTGAIGSAVTFFPCRCTEATRRHRLANSGVGKLSRAAVTRAQSTEPVVVALGKGTLDPLSRRCSSQGPLGPVLWVTTSGLLEHFGFGQCG